MLAIFKKSPAANELRKEYLLAIRQAEKEVKAGAATVTLSMSPARVWAARLLLMGIHPGEPLCHNFPEIPEAEEMKTLMQKVFDEQQEVEKAMHKARWERINARHAAKKATNYATRTQE